MKTFSYSPSLNSFWFTDSPSIPDDAIEVDNDIFEEFALTPNNGMERVAKSDGQPGWQKVAELTESELQQQKVYEAEQAKSALLAVAKNKTYEWEIDLLLNMISDDDKVLLIKWREYSSKLKSIDTGSAPDIEWPQPPEV